MKEVYAENLILGSSVNAQPFYLTSVVRSESYKVQNSAISGYVLELQDRTGRVEGFIPEASVPSGLETLINRVVSVTGIVLKNNRLVIKCEALSLCTNYKPYNIICSLPESKKKAFKSLLLRQIDAVENNSYKELLKAIYTEDTIEQMANCPLSLKNYGNYCGAVLVGTVTIVNIALGVVNFLNQMGNGIYDSPVSRDLVLTVGLLQYCGKVKEFTTFPFKRTKESVCLGQAGVLQSTVYGAIRNKNIALSTAEVAELLSYVLPSLDPKGQIKASSNEAEILKHATEIYRSCDSRNKAVFDYRGEDETFFSPELWQYVKNTAV